jgi:hypothetical protein
MKIKVMHRPLHLELNRTEFAALRRALDVVSYSSDISPSEAETLERMIKQINTHGITTS